MSKEMKARLRQEYVGFGGAENKVGGWRERARARARSVQPAVRAATAAC